MRAFATRRAGRLRGGRGRRGSRRGAHERPPSGTSSPRRRWTLSFVRGPCGTPGLRSLKRLACASCGTRIDCCRRVRPRRGGDAALHRSEHGDRVLADRGRRGARGRCRDGQASAGRNVSLGGRTPHAERAPSGRARAARAAVLLRGVEGEATAPARCRRDDPQLAERTGIPLGQVKHIFGTNGQKGPGRAPVAAGEQAALF